MKKYFISMALGAAAVVAVEKAFDIYERNEKLRQHKKYVEGESEKIDELIEYIMEQNRKYDESI